jgi:hypothetical protein
MTRPTLALVFVLAAGAAADDPDRATVELIGSIDGRGLPMAECDFGVHRIKLVIGTSGEGPATLILDQTPNLVDEWGAPVIVKSEPLVKFECALKRVGKKKALAEGRPGAPAVETELEMFEITGPKIVSKLSLVRETTASWAHARFLWATKEGKNRTLVELTGPQPVRQILPPPCHPGCFPAGTLIETPKGTKRVEDLRNGDVITTIRPDGTRAWATVAAMFMTKNRLAEVNIDGKTLITTTTQPLALADGKIRPSGELQPGDRIQVWEKGERSTARVKSVDVTLRDAPVYNVVVGEPALFVANGFIARTKPPAPAIVAP